MVPLFSNLEKKERAPGQSLEVIVSRLPMNDLESIAGSDLLRLLKVVKPKGVFTTLRSGAYYFLKTSFRDQIAKENTRTILYSAMTPVKLKELCTRLGLDNVAALETLDPTENTEIWSTYAGFFGFNAQESVHYSVPPDATTITPAYPLFAHQRPAADEAYRFIRSDRERVMLHMPTGSGKTRTAMHVICRYINDSEPRVVVWVASSSELLEQAAEAFQNAWRALGNRDVSIYRYWGQYDADFSSLKDGILIAGFQKLYASSNASPLSLLQLGSRVGLVVIDEAHQAIAPSYQEVIERIANAGIASGIVGLSATPGRTWSDVDADEQLARYFDKHKVVLRAPDGGNPVTFLIQNGYLAHPKFTQIPFRDAECVSDEKRSSAMKDFDPETLEHVAALADRNAIILGEIERLIGDGHTRIILFAASVRHAELLTVALMSLGVHAILLTADTPPPDRMRSIMLFRGASDMPMVLCNFGVLTTGFDAPRTSAAVIVRPTRSLVLYSQMVGRAIRGPAAGGNEACEIVTIVDTALPGFGDVADAFSNWEDVWNV